MSMVRGVIDMRETARHDSARQKRRLIFVFGCVREAHKVQSNKANGLARTARAPHIARMLYMLERDVGMYGLTLRSLRVIISSFIANATATASTTLSE
jgi:hypothetical protein